MRHFKNPPGTAWFQTATAASTHATKVEHDVRRRYPGVRHLFIHCDINRSAQQGRYFLFCGDLVLTHMGQMKRRQT